MLFGRRKRLEDISKAEAKGRSLWTDELDEQARTKIVHLIVNLSGKYGRKPLVVARQFTLQELGRLYLSDTQIVDTYDDQLEDICRSIIEADNHIVFSILEAILRLPSLVESEITYPNLSYSEVDQLSSYLRKLSKELRTILREHRVSFSLDQGRFISFESRIMHENVVVPTLALLGNYKKYDNVEKAYREALTELHDGSPDDAITDASTALQEALSALGCEGNSLGPLANSAVAKKVIDSHDKKLIDWVSADRSTKGDTHHISSASTEDAWLTVHVVGAIILRICGGPLRSSREAR